MHTKEVNECQPESKNVGNRFATRFCNELFVSVCICSRSVVSFVLRSSFSPAPLELVEQLCAQLSVTQVTVDMMTATQDLFDSD